MSDEENSTAQVEFAGMSLSGSKMLLLIPLLGSLGGALWGGFEVYQRLLDAEEAITTYVAPDMSGIEQKLAVQQTQMDEFKNLLAEQYKLTTESMSQLNSRVSEISQTSKETEKFVRDIDKQMSETQRDLRNNVYAMEQTLTERIREMDKDLKTTRDELNKSIQTILANPLNQIE
jgi:gas vesicle protein